MTPFLVGLIGGVVMCGASLWALLRSAKRTQVVCRALMAIHHVEDATSQVFPTAPKNAPKIMTQQEFSEVADALVGLGAKKMQAQQMVKSAFEMLTANGAALTTDAMLKCAMEMQGARKETRVQ